MDRWTSDFAYGLGLFTADGCLSSDGRHLDFTSKNLEQIENFKLAWKLESKVSNKRSGYSPQGQYYRTQFGNVKLYRWLVSVGITPKKSLSIKRVDIPNIFLGDFLRGYLDGDGSISFSIHSESKLPQIKIRFASGSRIFLEWLKIRLGDLYELDGGYIVQCINALQLVYCKRDSLKLISHMYHSSESIALSRKKERAIAFIGNSTGFIPKRWGNRYTS